MGRPYIMSIDFYDQATSDKNVVALEGSELLNGRIDLNQSFCVRKMMLLGCKQKQTHQNSFLFKSNMFKAFKNVFIFVRRKYLS